jgi:hypothetical protein
VYVFLETDAADCFAVLIFYNIETADLGAGENCDIAGFHIVDEHVPDGLCLVTHGEHTFLGFGLGGHVARMEKVEAVLYAMLGECGEKEFAIAFELGKEYTLVKLGIGDVGAPAAGDEELLAERFILLYEHYRESTFRGPTGSHHASRSATDHGDVVFRG